MSWVALVTLPMKSGSRRHWQLSLLPWDVLVGSKFRPVGISAKGIGALGVQ